jgi:hypothetical protein
MLAVGAIALAELRLRNFGKIPKSSRLYNTPASRLLLAHTATQKREQALRLTPSCVWWACLVGVPNGPGRIRTCDRPVMSRML